MNTYCENTLLRNLVISRGNGIFVPLVAADELPDGINLCGVPRTMNTTEAYGMLYLGTYPNVGHKHRLGGAIESSSPPEYPTVSNKTAHNVNAVATDGRINLHGERTRQSAHVLSSNSDSCEGDHIGNVSLKKSLCVLL